MNKGVDKYIPDYGIIIPNKINRQILSNPNFLYHQNKVTIE